MFFWRNSKYKVPFLIISSALLIGGILFYIRTPKTVAPVSEQEEVIPEGWLTHKNSTLGIEFSYPPSWGPMEQKTEPCYFEEEDAYLHIYQDQPCRHVFLLASGLENNSLLVSSQSMLFAEYGQIRDQYFGDLVTVARKQGINIGEFVSLYCQEEAGAKKGETCQTEGYPNGIVITKSVQGPIIETEDNKDKKVVYYIIYRPNRAFDNLIFSTEFLPDAMSFADQKKMMDKIVSTLILL